LPQVEKLLQIEDVAQQKYGTAKEAKLTLGDCAGVDSGEVNMYLGVEK
jgi:hypothetical protein